MVVPHVRPRAVCVRVADLAGDEAGLAMIVAVLRQGEPVVDADVPPVGAQTRPIPRGEADGGSDTELARSLVRPELALVVGAVRGSGRDRGRADRHGGDDAE